jgi:hypothetical protein
MVGVGEASLPVVGVGVGLPSLASGEGVSVPIGRGVPEGEVSGDSESVGVGERAPVVVVVGGRIVAVAAVSMMRSVGVDDGIGRGDDSGVLVGGILVPSGLFESVDCNRVALGKIVIRGAGELGGVHEA